MASLPDPLATDASLHLICDHLARALAQGDIEPALIHVAGVDERGFDLGLRPLDGAHPTGLLLSTTAPDDWHAAGVVTSGWAYHRDPTSSSSRIRHRIHLATLVSRTGEIAHTVEGLDDVDLDPPTLSGQPPEGEQVDLLRRSLGLPTPPAPCDASVFWVIRWLGTIADQRPDRWTDVLEAHPAMALLENTSSLTRADTLELIGAFHRVCSWSRLRTLTSTGVLAVPELRADDASWLDEGSFARFVLNRSPSLQMARAEVASVLGPRLADRLERTLDGLGIPRRAWPDAPYAA